MPMGLPGLTKQWCFQRKICSKINQRSNKFILLLCIWIYLRIGNLQEILSAQLVATKNYICIIKKI